MKLRLHPHKCVRKRQFLCFFKSPHSELNKHSGCGESGGSLYASYCVCGQVKNVTSEIDNNQVTYERTSQNRIKINASNNIYSRYKNGLLLRLFQAFLAITCNAVNTFQFGWRGLLLFPRPRNRHSSIHNEALKQPAISPFALTLLISLVQ